MARDVALLVAVTSPWRDDRRVSMVKMAGEW